MAARPRARRAKPVARISVGMEMTRFRALGSVVFSHFMRAHRRPLRELADGGSGLSTHPAGAGTGDPKTEIGDTREVGTWKDRCSSRTGISARTSERGRRCTRLAHPRRGAGSQVLARRTAVRRLTAEDHGTRALVILVDRGARSATAHCRGTDLHLAARAFGGIASVSEWTAQEPTTDESPLGRAATDARVGGGRDGGCQQDDQKENGNGEQCAHLTNSSIQGS